jgi:hypothetical protein
VAAALVLKGNKSAIPSQHIRFVSTEVVAGLHIAIDNQPGDTWDADMNSRHRDIRNLTGRQATEILREMVFTDPADISANTIARTIASGILSGHLVVPNDQTIPKDILADLHKKNLLQFNVPTAA